jgi:hypothetical protein
MIITHIQNIYYTYLITLLYIKIRLMHLHMLTPFYSIEILQVSALKGPSLGSTDTFCEQGQQKTCPDVNIRLKSSI